MEYLKGETLSERLERSRGRLPAQTALQITWQIATALAAAHQKGIVHRGRKFRRDCLTQRALGHNCRR